LKSSLLVAAAIPPLNFAAADLRAATPSQVSEVGTMVSDEPLVSQLMMVAGGGGILMVFGATEEYPGRSVGMVGRKAGNRRKKITRIVRLFIAKLATSGPRIIGPALYTLVDVS